MSEKNKIVAQRIVEDIFNKTNINNLEELVSNEIVIHDTDKQLRGLDQLRQGINHLHTAFPDLQYIIEDLLEDDDKVIARCKGTGTHDGPFRGIPATGRKMAYSVIMIWRFTGNKLCEHWSVSDVFGMLQQLEVIEIKQRQTNP
jgi:steroid delta-isomerase-like uncharacterized protein